MTRKNLEKQWRSNLSSILDELSDEDYKKVLFLHLDKIPGGMKDKQKCEMPQIIIQRYGLDMSIKVISKAMDDILRKDCVIQDLIQPMLQKLEDLNQQERKPAGAAGGKNVQSSGRPLKRKRQSSPQPEVDSGASMKAKQKDSSLNDSSAALQKKTIKDLKASGDLGQKILTVKVVRKSNLCQNKTRTKFYFYLGVADETDAIKVVLFGSKQFEDIKEGHFYIIKDASMDHQGKEKVLKVTEKKTLPETRSLKVPRNVELKAEKLIFSPVYSIRDIQSFGHKMPVSVEGTVKEINQTKKDEQNFKLEDGTGSIKIKFWAEDTKHLDGISNGNVVRVNNLQTNLYEGRVSLNSTRITKKKSTLDLRKTIRDLKASGDLGQKVLTVKVLQKSNLCQYQIKANETKFRFYLGVADETDAIKIQVYGKERFPAIEEGHFYIIRDPLLDHQENVLKISEKTRMSEIRPFRVPRNVELEAEKLIFSPVYSIRDIQSFGDKTPVSVEGTVKEIGVIKSINMKAKRMKKDKQNFELEDGTGSITVDLWGEDTKHLRGISNGDVVLVNNLKTNLYNDNVSLNSTDSTRITKIQSAPVQDVNIKIIGISKFNRNNAELEVQIKDQVKTLEVSSLLLAKGVGLHLGDNFRAKLLEKLVLKAKAQIQGNKINKLKALA